MDTCTFSYIAKKDFSPKTATGIERTWIDLKIECNRHGQGLAGAKYYKTISFQGPELFAVQLDQSVWYHDQNKWHRYQTASNVKYDKIQSSDLNPTRAMDDLTISDDDDEQPFSVEEGHNSSNNNSRTHSESSQR
ncbi:unnamed protein product [Didymodactylos carnosus]|uniref:Uncharacterized protein n=1 Tax=Didymodactylos carnosus TaxID=1234261 RepID=A0A814SKW8_9BILA|nr:unnamed protein product [Didymodactylos carnosus]CAF3910943.1 unnamed protein product [Didymodactylos carnosus]